MNILYPKLMLLKKRTYEHIYTHFMALHAHDASRGGGALQTPGQAAGQQNTVNNNTDG